MRPRVSKKKKLNVSSTRILLRRLQVNVSVPGFPRRDHAHIGHRITTVAALLVTCSPRSFLTVSMINTYSPLSVTSSTSSACLLSIVQSLTLSRRFVTCFATTVVLCLCRTILPQASPLGHVRLRSPSLTSRRGNVHEVYSVTGHDDLPCIHT